MTTGMDVPPPPYEARSVISGAPVWRDRLSGNLALEMEIGPRNGWFSVGGTGWVLGEGSKSSPWLFREYNGTVFMRARWPVSPTDDVSALIGANRRYGMGTICAETCFRSIDGSWLILGAAWRHQTDRYWLHVTPQVELGWDLANAGWTSWGLPWVEGGWWLTPKFGLGARFGPGLVQAVWRI